MSPHRQHYTPAPHRAPRHVTDTLLPWLAVVALVVVWLTA
jgi:hypothetical protein